MIFVSKHGSLTSTEDQRETWRKHGGMSLLVFAVVALLDFVTSAPDPPWIPQYFLASVQVNLSSVSSCKNLGVVKSATCPRGRLPLLQLHQINQCLYLDDEVTLGSACDSAMWGRQVHLRFCTLYNLESVVGEKKDQCDILVARAREMDAIAQVMACQFELLLSRYDCDSGYSVKWSCDECRRVYRQWVCAMFIPFHIGGQHIKPCRSFCHVVEQKCPYFHPIVKEQYAGERVFKCIDPDIPDTPVITPNSSYGPRDQCYSICHLQPDFAGCPTSVPGSGNNFTDSISLPSLETSINYSEPMVSGDTPQHSLGTISTPPDNMVPSGETVNSTTLYSNAALRTVNRPHHWTVLCVVVVVMMQQGSRTSIWTLSKGLSERGPT